MRYQRSLEIEQRLNAVLRLIRAGKHATSAIAERLGVSIPTVSRYVQALRDRGHSIKAGWHEGSWRYVLVSQASTSRRRPARDTSNHAVSESERRQA